MVALHPLGDSHPSSRRRPSRRRYSSRRGVTLRDTIIGFVVVLILAALIFPLFLKLRERGRRMECQANLRNIGLAIGRYHTLSNRRAYPVGAAYSVGSASAGGSWWLDILPYVDTESPVKKWNREIANNGDFTLPTANNNVEIADGLQLTIFYCPSSELPLFADPARFMSEVNRRALAGREVKGVPIPMYVAIAGSAPDGLGYEQQPNKDFPSGRNTRDSRYGILSASGVFPPNSQLEQAALVDQKARIIIVAEQSDYVRDQSLDPMDLYDVRSSWPRGAFMGTRGNYQIPKPAAKDINGTGTERCWNITSVRYPLNFREIKGKPGIVTDPPPPRPAKEGDPPPPLPPYPPEGYGPGHNNPLLSGHPEGVQVLMADDSVNFLNEKLDLGLLIKMCTRDDKVDVNLP
jgi:hypothetical protein